MTFPSCVRRRRPTPLLWAAALAGCCLLGVWAAPLMAQEANAPPRPSPRAVDAAAPLSDEAPADAGAEPLVPAEASGRRPEPADVAKINVEKVAQKLLQCTVTVRVSVPKPAAPVEDGKPHPRPEGANIDAGVGGVTVASGVSVGEGWIVTFVNTAAGARIRVTLPTDGQSLDARVRVVDRYSGLTLLQVATKEKLPGVELAREAPAVGATLFTAAGSGVEAPLVSFGILGGTNRSVLAVLPPLLQCDLRTAANSGGAGVLDGDGRLVGVVVATETTAERAGWTYAAPVSFVHRLLAHAPSDDEERIVVLERRRPELGLTMRSGQELGVVEVERVREDGVAAQAGFQSGDVVLEADGVKVRSVYQAVALVLSKQPGDRVPFLIKRGQRELRLDVTLGNAVKPTWLAADGLPELGVGSSLVVRRNGSKVEVRELNFDVEENAALDGEAKAGDKPARLPRDGLSLLREQMVRWSRVIEAMQVELQRRDDRIRELEDQLRKYESQPAR